MKIAIMGGAFNPIHLGHLAIAHRATEQLGLDQVFFVPTGTPVHRSGEELASAEDRVRMIQRAIHGVEAYRLSSVEIDRSGPSYMIDTIRQLKADSPSDTWYLLIGEDNLSVKWKAWDQILESVQVVVYPRAGGTEPDRMDPRIMLLDLPLLEYASSEIREKVRNGESVAALVPKEVASYIDEHQLYR